MHWVTYTCCENFSLNCIVVVDQADVGDKLHPVCRNIVKTANKRRYISCTCLGSAQRLRRRKTKRTVCLDSLIAQRIYSLNPIFNQRNLFHNIISYGSNLTSLFYYFIIFSRYYFCRNITINYITYSGNMSFKVTYPYFHAEAWISSHPI